MTTAASVANDVSPIPLHSASNSHKRNANARGFLTGGLAACMAVTFTNPFEVIKTRLQLSGELDTATKRAEYKNAFRAGATIYRGEGISGIQRGLGPAYGYQLLTNGTRLGSYEPIKNYLHTLFNGKGSTHSTPSTFTSVIAGAISGIAGAFVGSPLFLIKTRMQSQTTQSAISVGYQHSYKNSIDGLSTILKTEGIKGLYRGVDAAMLRTGIGSAVQLSTYDASKRAVLRMGYFEDALGAHALASLFTGFLVCVVMTPPDVISTRAYNQPHDPITGKGLYYKNPADCFVKTVRAEGIMALYKGFWPHYFRIGPHTVLMFVFLEQLRSFSAKYWPARSDSY